MDQRAREKSLLARDLAFAQDKGELEVYYQLQNDTGSREIIGVEALLRWHHPVNGMVSPGVFIPIAEENGMILKLGDWVLETACAEAVGWAKPINVAVNVAAAQLEESGFVERVRDVLVKTGLPPSRLELEITESGIIADMGATVQVIRRLKLLGVKIAMDDYGTGYSSLSTLQSFPFDKIKIDREFVSAVDQSRQSAAIVQATIIMAESLDIPVLAEGVETEAQLNALRALGCNQVQGFLFGKPMPMAKLKALLENDEATIAVAA
jgi:EAL domain-containing protein (putative c-di-GMP-specific phosphodiesterase class I)